MAGEMLQQSMRLREREAQVQRERWRKQAQAEREERKRLDEQRIARERKIYEEQVAQLNSGTMSEDQCLDIIKTLRGLTDIPEAATQAGLAEKKYYGSRYRTALSKMNNLRFNKFESANTCMCLAEEFKSLEKYIPEAAGFAEECRELAKTYRWNRIIGVSVLVVIVIIIWLGCF